MGIEVISARPYYSSDVYRMIQIAKMRRCSPSSSERDAALRSLAAMLVESCPTLPGELVAYIPGSVSGRLARQAYGSKVVDSLAADYRGARHHDLPKATRPPVCIHGRDALTGDVLLIDDVATTGAHLTAGVTALRAMRGVGEIRVAVVASDMNPKTQLIPVE